MLNLICEAKYKYFVSHIVYKVMFMPSKVAHVRLPEAEYRFIDETIENGYFTSRTDFIKSAVRLQIHETSKRILADLKKKRRKKISHAELLKSTKKSRKSVYKEIWS